MRTGHRNRGRVFVAIAIATAVSVGSAGCGAGKPRNGPDHGGPTAGTPATAAGSQAPGVRPGTTPPHAELGTAGTAGGARGSRWLPTDARPLTLHWVLDGAVDLSDPVQAGLRDLSGRALPAPDVYDIDGQLNTAATVARLHRSGKKVICYFDAGVYETYRPDAARFQALAPRVWGNADEGWPNSYWLDIRRIDELRPIMQDRIRMCRDKGFDAVEPDEITNWSNDPGFPITYRDQLAYNRAIASWVHQAGMSVGLKGDLEQAHDLVGAFDWTLNEECFQYSECTEVTNSGPGADGRDYPGLQVFTAAHKAVWIAEYQSYPASAWASLCATSRARHFNTARYQLGLPTDGGRTPCPTASAGTW